MILIAREKRTYHEILVDSVIERYLDPAQMDKLTKSVQRRKWSFSSACSGSGMAEVAAHLLFKALGGSLTTQFFCEKVKFKRDFIRQVVVPKLGDSSGQQGWKQITG